MQTATVQIRQRGQLTVPAKFRAELPWLVEESTVTMESQGNALVVRPMHAPPLTETERMARKNEFDKLWKRLQEFGKKGKQGVRLSRFVIEDRQRRR